MGLNNIAPMWEGSSHKAFTQVKEPRQGFLAPLHKVLLEAHAEAAIEVTGIRETTSVVSRHPS